MSLLSYACLKSACKLIKLLRPVITNNKFRNLSQIRPSWTSTSKTFGVLRLWWHTRTSRGLVAGRWHSVCFASFNFGSKTTRRLCSYTRQLGSVLFYLVVAKAPTITSQKNTSPLQAWFMYITLSSGKWILLFYSSLPVTTAWRAMLLKRWEEMD